METSKPPRRHLQEHVYQNAKKVRELSLNYNSMMSNGRVTQAKGIKKRLEAAKAELAKSQRILMEYDAEQANTEKEAS